MADYPKWVDKKLMEFLKVVEEETSHINPYHSRMDLMDRLLFIREARENFLKNWKELKNELREPVSEVNNP